MEIMSPASPSQALALHSEGDSRFCAGGTALQLDWAKGLAKPASLIDLSRISELKDVDNDGAYHRIGALTTLVDLGRTHDIRTRLPLLHEAVGKVAGPSIRNQATLGGNVAGRSGCLLPALLTLGAKVEWLTPDIASEMPL